LPSIPPWHVPPLGLICASRRRLAPNIQETISRTYLLMLVLAKTHDLKKIACIFSDC